MYGNYDTSTAKNLMIVFELCDRDTRSDCKTEEEIKAWMNNKYFIIIENEKKSTLHEF